MITIANWVGNLFMLGLGTFFLAAGMFIFAVMGVTLMDMWRKWRGN